MLHDAAGAYDATIWIGPTYLPVFASIQMPDQTIKIHYINYNASVDVAMPQPPESAELRSATVRRNRNGDAVERR